MRTQIRHIMWRLIRVYIVCLTEFPSQVGVVGWCDGPGRRTVWMIVGQGPVALALVAGGGCLDIFTLLCPFSPLYPSLWETA